VPGGCDYKNDPTDVRGLSAEKGNGFMIQMISVFDLKDTESLEDFTRIYTRFIADLKSAQLIESAGPIGVRVSDTPMDTDAARGQQFATLITFKDRTQMDASYAYISQRRAPGTANHIDMNARIANGMFTCWAGLWPE